MSLLRTALLFYQFNISSIIPILRNRRRLLRHTEKPFAVFISHRDYWEGVGGTERYQLEDMKQCMVRGINVFQLFPGRQRVGRLFWKRERRVFGVNLNDTLFTRNVPVRHLRWFMRQFTNAGSLISFNVHHLLAWRDKELLCLLRTMEHKKILVYLHDLYFCCPSVNLLFNSETYCGALEKAFRGEECLQCVHGPHRLRMRNFYQTLFEVAARIIVASEVVRTAFCSYYPSIEGSKLVRIEHLKLSYSHPKRHHSNKRLRIAFLGAKDPLKGWDCFETLSENQKLRGLYDFYHIGAGTHSTAAHIRQIQYSIKKEGFKAAIRVLLLNNIDIVLLLSCVPEAYSYTMHEAYAAGIPIITKLSSGNIAYKISEGLIYGAVFKSRAELESFLLDQNSVSRFLENNTNRFISRSEMQSAFLQLIGELTTSSSHKSEKRYSQ